jgi:hypothetical protein
MKGVLTGVSAALMLAATPAFAHRVDEYLQATLIGVEKDRVHVEMRLAPGVAVLPRVLATIDKNADGVLSPVEQRGYAEQVMHDVSIAVDGDRLQLAVIASTYSTIEMLKEGMGDIRIELEAFVPRRSGSHHLTFENHHEPGISAYLVNAEASADPTIRISGQSRNYVQSSYRLDYSQTRPVSHGTPLLLAGCVVASLLVVAQFGIAARQERAG